MIERGRRCEGSRHKPHETNDYAGTEAGVFVLRRLVAKVTPGCLPGDILSRRVTLLADEAASTALSAPRDAVISGGAGGDVGPSSDEVLAAAAPNRSPSFRPGVVIADKYVVERLIGEGGIGVVVAAKHVQLEQMVAIKYLRPKALGSAAVAERFLREARLAAKIRSDHVARVYDVGTLASGAPFMVMEYLSGMDLGRMLGAMGPLPVWRAVDYMLQACEALGAAHAAGIIHRDIKPENLFVTTGASGDRSTTT